YNLVNLRRLAPDGVRAMVQTMFEVQQVSDEFLGVLYDETEGNPFFVEEVLKSLVEEGAIYREDGRWQRKEIVEIQVPKSIREVIGRRLERVSDTCQRALSVGAVIGRRFRFETVQAVGDLGEDELLNALEEAGRAQLIREESEAGKVDYDFAHALIREVLYERLSARRRISLHQKVGETLELEYPGRLDAVVEDLAHHFTEAPHGENLRKAIEYSVAAAEKAMRLFAYEDAVRFYENAADLLKELGDEARLAEVQQAGAEPFAHLDKADIALAWCQSALDYHERVGRTVEAARVHRLMGRVLQRHRRFTAAIPHLETALQQLDAERYPEDAIQAHLDIARALSFLGDIEAAEAHAETALRLATDRGSLAMQAEAHVSLGYVLFSRFELDAAQRHNDEAIRLARAAGEREAGFTLYRALRNKGVNLGNRGARREALDLFHEELAVSERLRDLGLIATAQLNLVTAYWFGMGDGARARFHVQQALELPLSPSHRETAELWTRMFEGDWEGALAIREAAAKQLRETGELQTIYDDRFNTASLLLDLDRDQEAYDEAREAASIAEANPMFLVQYPRSLIYLTHALSRGGDRKRAEELIKLTEEGARRANSSTARVSLLIARGALALHRNDHEAAVQALAEEPQTIVPPMEVWRHRFLAEALARRDAPGDLERARDEWNACRAILEQMMDHRRVKLFQEQLAPFLAT
ncbi:MAG: ATP-binding protein, partial [bacterium]